ncbi:hypothetical protein CI610_01483 [invertebrate metagenome]|uniref:Uncharacterized protein n=1 Tax=invertebrate metagenome TaxID=1711999 RepID=A0A2H9T8J1_9ZZZZ
MFFKIFFFIGCLLLCSGSWGASLVKITHRLFFYCYIDADGKKEFLPVYFEHMTYPDIADPIYDRIPENENKKLLPDIVFFTKCVSFGQMNSVAGGFLPVSKHERLERIDIIELQKTVIIDDKSGEKVNKKRIGFLGCFQDGTTCLRMELRVGACCKNKDENKNKKPLFGSDKNLGKVHTPFFYESLGLNTSVKIDKKLISDDDCITDEASFDCWVNLKLSEASWSREDKMLNTSVLKCGYKVIETYTTDECRSITLYNTGNQFVDSLCNAYSIWSCYE